MSRNLKERVRGAIAQNHMIREGDTVCVGCSGGADSTLLLVLLCEFREENAFGFPFSVTACHVNHHLRGAESDGDERFVRDLCGKLGIPIRCVGEDVRSRAERTGTGLEEAGREARLDAFRECLLSCGATKIALAHHADDQAETVLYHLARGSALTGLSGMRPVSGNVIRPFLAVTHREICEELTAREILWRTDSSNESDRFARNRIRHGLIPELERSVHGGAARHITETAELVRMADDFIGAEARERAKKYVAPACKKHAVCIADDLISEPEIIRRRVLMDCLCRLAGGRKDIGRVHIESLLELFGRERGKGIDLPYGIRAVREEDRVALAGPGAETPASARHVPPEPARGRFMPAEPAGNGLIPAVTGRAEPVRITGSGTYRFEEAVIEVEIKKRAELCADMPRDRAGGLCVPQKTYTKWLNYDKIKKGLLIRNRLPGDYLTLDADGNKQKLKNYFVNCKIGRDIRDRVILLADESHVYWAVGGRISADAKIGPDTERVIRIKVNYTDGNGGSGTNG